MSDDLDAEILRLREKAFAVKLEWLEEAVRRYPEADCLWYHKIRGRAENNRLRIMFNHWVDCWGAVLREHDKKTHVLTGDVAQAQDAVWAANKILREKKEVSYAWYLDCKNHEELDLRKTELFFEKHVESRK